MTFKSGIKPYTERERNRDDADRRAIIKRGVTRRNATPSGQFYNVPGTPQSKAHDERVLGEAVSPVIHRR